jgi:hypothetical protein
VAAWAEPGAWNGVTYSMSKGRKAQ